MKTIFSLPNRTKDSFSYWNFSSNSNIKYCCLSVNSVKIIRKCFSISYDCTRINLSDLNPRVIIDYRTAIWIKFNPMSRISLPLLKPFTKDTWQNGTTSTLKKNTRLKLPENPSDDEMAARSINLRRPTKHDCVSFLIL